MGLAVELFFNPRAEQKIIEIWNALGEAGISSTMMEIGSRPHISLAVWNELDLSELEPELASFAGNITSFTITLSGIGAFPSSGAVYLEPEPTESLRTIHSHFHKQIQALRNGMWEYYLPGRWVPHCALAVDLPPEMVNRVTEVCRDVYEPIKARVEQVGVVEFRPVKQLLTYQLAQ